MNRKMYDGLLFLLLCVWHVAHASIGPSVGGDIVRRDAVYGDVAQMRARLESFNRKKREALEKVALASIAIKYNAAMGVVSSYVAEASGRKIVFSTGDSPVFLFKVKYLTPVEAQRMCRVMNRYINGGSLRRSKSLQECVGLLKSDSLTNDSLKMRMQQLMAS